MHLNARYLKDRMWGVGGREAGSRGRACTCAVCCAQLLSPVRLFATLWTAARQAPVSMGFSRREHWSGLPCPPPGDLPNPGIEPRSPALQVDSLLSEPTAKPKNTGMCSLSLLQGIFPTQESNWGLLHCKQILYQLSHQGSSLTPAIIK